MSGDFVDRLQPGSLTKWVFLVIAALTGPLFGLTHTHSFWFDWGRMRGRIGISRSKRVYMGGMGQGYGQWWRCMRARTHTSTGGLVWLPPGAPVLLEQTG